MNDEDLEFRSELAQNKALQEPLPQQTPANSHGNTLGWEQAGLVRLNKIIADSGYCARRKADALIAASRVQVNGTMVTTAGHKVNPLTDTVTVDWQPLPKPVPIYLAFHKPTGFVSTRQGQGKQKTIYDLIPNELHTVDPAGRLDADSSGLMLLSNDGHFVHTLTHPGFHRAKVYDTGLNQPLDEQDLKQLQKGILLQPENKLARMDIAPISAEASPWLTQANRYRITLMTGYNRQIRRSIESVGARVRELHRISFGPILLGDLPSGAYRELSQQEMEQLKV